MAAPENVSFPATLVLDSAHPLCSFLSLQRQASLPGPSSSSPEPLTSATLTSPEPSGIRVPEQSMHKNRLQEYTQRSNMQLPIYGTRNEGSAHAPKFTSTVWVDGKLYTSKNVFFVRKAAEQHVAKLAYEQIVTKINDEGHSDIFEIFGASVGAEFIKGVELSCYVCSFSGPLRPRGGETFSHNSKMYQML